VKLQLLPSTFDANGTASPHQHLTCFIIDDTVAIDAGSLAMAASPTQRSQVRDIVLTHAHLDHVAGLPLFVDDLFSGLTEPVIVHAAQSIINILEENVFNWDVYPRFSELSNANGPVLRYKPFTPDAEFSVKHLRFRPIEVNHKVACFGYLFSDGEAKIALSGDTAEMDGFWSVINQTDGLSAILLECAFPNELEDLAEISHHLTPARLKSELSKCELTDCPVYVINLKPMYRDTVIEQLKALGLATLKLLEVGKTYEFGLHRSRATEQCP
jgi:ribonuclease BN (tRNA processing enzyme)